MQWMTMTSVVPCHALHAPQHAAASPFGPLGSFLTDRSKVVPLFQFFVCASVVSYVAFMWSIFVPHLSFFWCLERSCFVFHLYFRTISLNNKCACDWVLIYLPPPHNPR